MINDVVNSINTPGIYYALAYNLACWVVYAVNGRKRPLWVTIIYQLVYFCVLGSISLKLLESD